MGTDRVAQYSAAVEAVDDLQPVGRAVCSPQHCVDCGEGLCPRHSVDVYFQKSIQHVPPLNPTNVMAQKANPILHLAGAEGFFCFTNKNRWSIMYSSDYISRIQSLQIRLP